MALRSILPPPNKFSMQHFIIEVVHQFSTYHCRLLEQRHISFKQPLSRSYYRTAVKESKDKVHTFTADDVFTPPPVGAALASGTGPRRVHYSFDFAQQVHYPHNPLQPGPIYFKTPRKCAVFGVCCEAIPRQVNTTSLTKQVTQGRVQIQLLVSSITFLAITVLGSAS